MIILSIGFNHGINQKLYDILVKHVPLLAIRCSCGCKGQFIRYGHYFRTVKGASIKVRLKISRVRCKCCGTTHALLPSNIVMYSQLLVKDLLLILLYRKMHKCYDRIMQNNVEIDENNIKYVISRYCNPVYRQLCWRKVHGTYYSFQHISELDLPT